MHTNAIFRFIPSPRRRLLLLLSVGLCLLLALGLLRPSLAVSVSEVPNPQQLNGTWVTDMADMISDRSEAELNRMISALEATNGSEIAVVTVPDTQPSSSPKAFATELFNTWGIGKEEQDNGVLFLVSKGDRRSEIETGYGVEGVLTDARAGAILDQDVTPKFKAGDFDAGILAGTAAIIDLLEDSSAGLAGSSAGVGAPVSFTEGARNSSGAAITCAIAAAVAIIFRKRATAAFSSTFSQKRLNPDLGKPINPIKIAPTGRSELSLTKRFLGPLLDWLIRAVVGAEMLKVKGLIPDKPGYGSDLLTHRYSDQLIKSSKKRLGIAFGLALILGFINSVIYLLVLPTLAWLWIAREIWLSKKAISPNPSQSIGQSLSLVAPRLIGISLSILAILIFLPLGLGILGLWLFPAVWTALFSTCAGMFRLVRALNPHHSVVCKACNGTMQQLNKTEIKRYVSKAEFVEMKLGTKRHEGWKCPACMPGVPADELSIHIFSTVTKRNGYKDCSICKATTLEAKKTTLVAATTTSKGKMLLTDHCHCCGKHNETEITLAKLKPKTSSSSSYSGGYSGSSYSGSSYSGGSSSGGSSGGGGSFGGGSSGGGGAGSSW